MRNFLRQDLVWEPLNAFSTLKQGDAITYSDSTEVLVIISQTCDVVLDKREFVATVQAVCLLDQNSKSNFGKNPMYLKLQGLGENVFADLSQVTSHSKKVLLEAGMSFTNSIEVGNVGAEREFAHQIGRWFTRFPFPDQVQPWLSPLESFLAKSNRKINSPLSAAVKKILQIRVECDDWGSENRNLKIVFILPASALPIIDIENEIAAPDFSEKTVNQLVELICDEKLPNAHLNLVWSYFCQKLVDKCIPDKPSSEIDRAVGKIEFELTTDAEFTLAQFSRSEILDVHYLSNTQWSEE